MGIADGCHNCATVMFMTFERVIKLQNKEKIMSRPFRDKNKDLIKKLKNQ